MKIPDWLHHIPSHWEIRKASHILDISVGGTPPTSNPDFFDGDIPWVTIADMNSDEIFGSSHYLSESGLRHANIRWSEPGDLLYSFKLSIGKTAFVKNPVVTNEAIATIHKSSKIYLPFARYMLPLAFEHAAGTNIYGAKILNQQQLKSALIPLPPLDEQKKIADELDRELAEIDAFIADQQKLHDLSIEYHLSQVHQLVTKGTRKNIVLTDSKFDWIGSIPSHWSLQKIGWLFNDIGSGTTPSTSDESAFEAGTINWVTTSELRENGISVTKHQINQETLSRYSALKIHPTNSLLIAMYGATIGRLGWLEEPATTNQAVCALSNPTNVLPKYAFYALLAAKKHILTLASGGGQPNINQDIIRNLKVPVPPIEEQEIITRKLDRQALNLQNSAKDYKQIKELLELKEISTIVSILSNKGSYY